MGRPGLDDSGIIRLDELMDELAREVAREEHERQLAEVSTTGRPNDVASACGGSGPEGILRVVSDVAGALEARATTSYSGILLHARNQCSDPATEIPRASCTSNQGVFSTYVAKDTPIYLYVDGINGASGAAQLQITVTP